ncbi:MAG: PadR family transcriptional regulator [Gemmatimonadota bacterium]
MTDRGTTRPVAGTSFYVLLALADQPRYGLGIAEEVARRTGGEIRLGPGTLYGTLKKLLEEGHIGEVTPSGHDQDPRRRYYGILPAGRLALSAEAARLEQLVFAARAKGALPLA